eukprot:CAMPEP_0197673260 /NCGR_PEP_ID=MMETSP1338-20131121/80636_1 /TAXON_ID=43686 ORGANISM="Pelagodinium beii, Strain RCC1491" /NCGR_SAMPLE_ID=MMETSP1338 /ASSEMBLY_ACC=CAM_ASM_000754 /LENGTH=63 /DNA_ID=CAMNT_0043253485 /DNA_START=313 /DNA_END=500 /DNA_ORIENTATION=+
MVSGSKTDRPAKTASELAETVEAAGALEATMEVTSSFSSVKSKTGCGSLSDLLGAKAAIRSWT